MFIRKIGELLLWLGPEENFYRLVQLKIMPERFKALSGKGTSVILNSLMIKLHDNDNRRQFDKEFSNRVAKITENDF
jgi:hypothetical protein